MLSDTTEKEKVNFQRESAHHAGVEDVSVHDASVNAASIALWRARGSACSSKSASLQDIATETTTKPM